MYERADWILSKCFCGLSEEPGALGRGRVSKDRPHVIDDRSMFARGLGGLLLLQFHRCGKGVLITERDAETSRIFFHGRDELGSIAT